MYDNREILRSSARKAVEDAGYSLEAIRGAGARMQISKGGETLMAHVRTSSDRWLGWMRDDEGNWRGMDKADLIIAAVLDRQNKREAVEVFAFRPEDLKSAFNKNLAARVKDNPRLSKTAPIFICLDERTDESASAAASNLKSKALWCSTLALKDEHVADDRVPDSQTPKGKETKEGFVARVRQEFARLVGVPEEKVTVEFRVTF